MKWLGRGQCVLMAAVALIVGSLGFAPTSAWAAEEPAFAVIDTEGNETSYVNKSDAQNAMKDGYTFKLLRDYSGEWGIAPNNKARDITVDLNGFDVTCTKTSQSGGYAVSVKAAYGGARDCTVTVKNGGSEQSVLTSSYAQIRTGSGNSKFTQVVKIEGDIAFKDLTDGEAVKNGGSEQSVLTSSYAQIRTGSGNSKFTQVVKIEGDIAFKDLTDGEEALGIDLGTGAKLLDTPAARPLVPNGGFSVKEADGANYLYGDLGNAAGRSADGVVTMVNDYTGNDPIRSGSKNVTLDLGGHTYTFNGIDAAIDVNYPNVVFTMKNGAVAAVQSDGATLIGAPNEGQMNNRGLVLDGVKMMVSGADACGVVKNGAVAAVQSDGATLIGAPNEGQMNNRGLVLDGVKMMVSGADACGVVTNGTEIGNTVALKNSTLDVPNGYGIYFPSTGTVSINDSVINAKHAGVQMCAGSLSVAGGTSITVTGQPQQKTEGDGPIADGAAVSIVKREGYKDLGDIAVTDGAFVSASGVDAIKAYSFNNANKDEEEWAGSTDVVKVSGGTYSDISALKYAGDNVALRVEDGFSIMPGSRALESGALVFVTTPEGKTVYFTSTDDAKDFIEADGELDEGNIESVTYAVDFDLNGGTGNAGKQTVDAGKTATEPKDPKREGYEFLGWFAEGANSIYNFASPVTADLKLVAKWVKVWNLTFVYNNGDDDLSLKVRDGATVARPADPELKGWGFAGWFTVKNADGILDPESEYDFSKPVTSDLKLYGGWVEADDGKGDQESPDIQIPPADKPSEKPTDKPGGGLPQTGDASLLGIVTTGVAGALAVAAGHMVSRRRK